ncbi:MAG: hypothetical protein JW785_05615 [Acidimicrobiia bacterium]|nr:hypothetical protein [Acidimicrobiia bacterium]
MAERQGHPWIAGLVGLVTLEAVAFGSLFLLLLREEGWAVGLDLTTVGAAIGVAVLLLFLVGGAWCTWRVASGRWGLREAATMIVAPRRPAPTLPKEEGSAEPPEAAPPVAQRATPKVVQVEMLEDSETPSPEAPERAAPAIEEAGAPISQEAEEAGAPISQEAEEAGAPKPEEPASPLE